MTENIQTLLKIWTEFSKTYPKYHNWFRARHQGNIYTCSNGVITQEPGTALNKDDYSQECPHEESYLESDLEPENEQERKIIEDYNLLVKQKYQQALRRDTEEYQRSTIMIQYKTTATDDDYLDLHLDRYIKTKFKKYGVDVSVDEPMTRQCLIIVLLDELDDE